MKVITNPEQIKLRPKPRIWNFKDFEGQRFGRLYVAGYIGLLLNGNTYWLLHCDCGTYVRVMIREVTSGKRTSCGCDKESQKILSKNQKSEACEISRMG